jgi:hypothetical protein
MGYCTGYPTVTNTFHGLDANICEPVGIRFQFMEQTVVAFSYADYNQ